MAINSNVICQVDDLDAAVRQYQTQGCSVKWQSLTGCAVVDCEDTSAHVSETSVSELHSRGAHDRIDPAYADYWGEIPD